MTGKKLNQFPNMINKEEEFHENKNSPETNDPQGKNMEEYPGLNSTLQCATDMDEGELGHKTMN